MVQHDPNILQEYWIFVAFFCLECVHTNRCNLASTPRYSWVLVSTHSNSRTLCVKVDSMFRSVAAPPLGSCSFAPRDSFAFYRPRALRASFWHGESRSDTTSLVLMHSISVRWRDVKTLWRTLGKSNSVHTWHYKRPPWPCKRPTWPDDLRRGNRGQPAEPETLTDCRQSITLKFRW